MFLKKFCNKGISNFPSLTNNFKIPQNVFISTTYFNFATKMRQGVTKNKKDSAGRRLGIKKFGGEEVRESQIIARQRGFKWRAGENVHVGKDQTLHATKEGKVTFTRDPWSKKKRIFVHVVEQEIPNRKVKLSQKIIKLKI